MSSEFTLYTIAGALTETNLCEFVSKKLVKHQLPGDCKKIEYNQLRHDFTYRIAQKALENNINLVNDCRQELMTCPGIHKLDLREQSTVIEVLDEASIVSVENFGVPNYFLYLSPTKLALLSNEPDTIKIYYSVDPEDLQTYAKVVILKPRTLIIAEITENIKVL